ncbi:MAG: GNAT family N-acetyltransferase [Erythrobacter sp.]
MVSVRPVQPADAPAIAAIYAHHVLTGTGTFDTVPPDAAFWKAKIAAITAKDWPFLVAELEGEVAGYCYAAQLRERPAYAPACEDSIYVREDMLGAGVGTRLLGALIEAARTAGFEQMVAVIGGGGAGSVALHSKLGFVEVGRLRDVGFKFGRYLDSVYMQRSLRNPASNKA